MVNNVSLISDDLSNVKKLKWLFIWFGRSRGKILLTHQFSCCTPTAIAFYLSGHLLQLCVGDVAVCSGYILSTSSNLQGLLLNTGQTPIIIQLGERWW